MGYCQVANPADCEGGVFFVFTIGVIFVVLKLAGAAGSPWWLVLAPFWFSFSLSISMWGLMFFLLRDEPVAALEWFVGAGRLANWACTYVGLWFACWLPIELIVTFFIHLHDHGVLPK